MNKSMAIGVVAGTILSIGGLTVLMNKTVNQLKEQVKKTDISARDFQKLEKDIEKKALEWQHALDSLKTKGAIEKAYFEGAQMVRDSIANAPKKVLNVIK